jgi:DNA excision repair protein ERCC-4
MVYANSCEEHKYLAGIRKEKDAFQRLIKERGVSQSESLSFDMLDNLPLVNDDDTC